MPRKSQSFPPSMLDALLQELQQKTLLNDGTKKRRITKGQALMRSMVNEALNGDQKMLAAVLKLAEKLDVLQAQKHAATLPDLSDTATTSTAQWHAIFAFYGRYKHLIDAQIEQLKTEDPDYWEFEWVNESSLEKAPWHAALQSAKIAKPYKIALFSLNFIAKLV